jgi:DNA-binding NtrC family response regulator
MGLVNLRNASVLILSPSNQMARELKASLEKNKYKGVQVTSITPEALQILKVNKIEIIVADNDLGETKITDFLAAISKAFPKLKGIIINTKDKADSDYLTYSEVSYPVDVSKLIKLLEQAVMEKMGIASSAVTVDLKYR